MNEVIKAMKERRSIRKFKAEMPSKADLEQIVEAGLYAANGRGRQAVITIAVTDKELRDKLSAIVLANKEVPTAPYDGSLVMGNLMLAAHSLGLGSIWIHRAKEEFEMPEYQKLLKDLGIEGEWEGIGHCAVGYIDGENPAAAPRNDGRVFWVE